MLGRTGMEEYPQSAGPVPSGSHPRSFAARTSRRSNTDPSADSLTPHRMTIRAVTPEPELEFEAEEEDVSLALTHVTTTPPRTPSRSTIRSASSRWDLMGRSSPEPMVPSSPEKSRCVINRASAMVPSTHLADLSISRAKSQSPTDRMRARPSGASPPDEGKSILADMGSPPSSYVTRHRFVPTQGTPEASVGPTPMSVGYPSTHALQNLSQISSRPQITTKTTRHRLLRPQASVNTLQSQSSSSRESNHERQPSSPINAEYDTLVQLMKTLRGSMEGYVDFRIGGSMIWTKGYCTIDAQRGSLLYQTDENPASGPPSTIIPDLRGCQLRTSASVEDSDGIIDLSTHSSKIDMKLRPLGDHHYEYWLAALLCWKPIRPAGAQNKMVKSQMPILSKDKRRRNSDATVQNRGEVSIIKVGRMLLWRPERPTMPVANAKTHKSKRTHTVAWQNVSCTLQDTGEFRLHREVDSSLQFVVQLSQLSRCAVQQLDPSILDQDFCIAIYPQYTPMETSSLARPLYLSIESRVLFEVWFVLLKAFTMPEIYGPATMGNGLALGTISSESVSEQKSNVGLADSYRIQRSLFLRIVEAKINVNHRDSDRESMDCYSEVLLDGEVRAKTMVRTKTHNPFWREDYEFPDLPTVLSEAAIVLKQRDPRWKTKGSGTVTAGSGGFGGGLGGTSLPGSKDAIIGRVEIQLDELLFGGGKNEIEGWMPLVANYKEGVEERVGEMYVKVEMEELIVLMASEYKTMSNILHVFGTGLTLQLARVITDLKRLAETLLDIFQVSNKASEWLMALAENEIDGLHKEKPPIHDKPISNGSDGHSQPEGQRTRNGLTDANILFRGNSLLTKALDTHMKRVGREYLEDTLKEHLQHIASEDVYCEVDPMKVDDKANLDKNWKTLLSLTTTIWTAIYNSPDRCPLELRKILRHIRACVEDRYGDLFRTVSYSSVCGFLFLRFFCPAILNPKLFGLLKDHPGVRAQRTLTLITKSLQVLANMTTFGVKEPWMSPMNQFLAEHKVEMKDYVDSVTTLSPSLDKAVKITPPSYATPITILNRLSQPSKEGFPSLPYLIDQPRAFAALVTMWLKYYPLHVTRQTSPPLPVPELTPELAEFDDLCRGIQDRICDCIDRAENAERPGSSSSLSARWEEVAEKATGVAASSGVYTQTPGGSSRHLTRVASSNSSAGGMSISTTTTTGVWTAPASANDDPLQHMGYTAAVYSTSGSSKSKLSGFVGGLGGFRRKPKIGREEPMI